MPGADRVGEGERRPLHLRDRTPGGRAPLRDAGIDNVSLVVGDGSLGWPPEAPYDGINVAAAVEGPVPQPLLDQLADGGRLVAPLRDRDERLVVLHREGDRFERSDHGSVRFVPLVRELPS